MRLNFPPLNKLQQTSYIVWKLKRERFLKHETELLFSRGEIFFGEERKFQKYEGKQTKSWKIFVSLAVLFIKIDWLNSWNSCRKLMQISISQENIFHYENKCAKSHFQSSVPEKAFSKLKFSQLNWLQSIRWFKGFGQFAVGNVCVDVEATCWWSGWQSNCNRFCNVNINVD